MSTNSSLQGSEVHAASPRVPSICGDAVTRRQAYLRPLGAPSPGRPAAEAEDEPECGSEDDSKGELGEDDKGRSSTVAGRAGRIPSVESPHHDELPLHLLAGNLQLEEVRSRGESHVAQIERRDTYLRPGLLE